MIRNLLKHNIMQTTYSEVGELLCIIYKSCTLLVQVLRFEADGDTRDGGGAKVTSLSH